MMRKTKKTPDMKKYRRHRLSGLLVLLIIVAGAAIHFYAPDRDSQLAPALVKENGPVPQIVLTNIRQTHIRQGKKEWRLAADEARLSSDGNNTTLDKVVLSAPKADGSPVTVTADQGAFNRASGLITIFGNVIIDDAAYKISTESLHYQNSEGILYTNDPVTIDGESLHLQGRSMRYDLASNNAVLSGNVEGVFKTTL